MNHLQIRPATEDDAGACARIMFDAFESLATRHAFPIEPGTPEFTDFQMTAMLATDGIFALVAELHGEIVGSAMQDERGKIVGIGPVSVERGVQNAGVGRALMEALLQRSRERDVAGVRLIQTAYNYGSLSLYAKLGFAVRETLSVFQGSPRAAPIAGATVRPALPRTSTPAMKSAGACMAMIDIASCRTASTPAQPVWSSTGAISPAMRPGLATHGMPLGRPTTTSSRCCSPPKRSSAWESLSRHAIQR